MGAIRKQGETVAPNSISGWPTISVRNGSTTWTLPLDGSAKRRSRTTPKQNVFSPRSTLNWKNDGRHPLNRLNAGDALATGKFCAVNEYLLAIGGANDVTL